jgi:hypothetical protein
MLLTWITLTAFARVQACFSKHDDSGFSITSAPLQRAFGYCCRSSNSRMFLARPQTSKSSPRPTPLCRRCAAEIISLPAFSCPSDRARSCSSLFNSPSCRLSDKGPLLHNMTGKLDALHIESRWHCSYADLRQSLFHIWHPCGFLRDWLSTGRSCSILVYDLIAK